jgi:hypothetical protein
MRTGEFKMEFIDNQEPNITGQNQKHGSLFIVTAISILVEAILFVLIKWGYPKFDSGFELLLFTKKFYLIVGISYGFVVLFSSIAYFMASKTAKMVETIFILPVFVFLFTIVVGIFLVAAYIIVDILIFDANVFVSLGLLAGVAYMVYKLVID